MATASTIPPKHRAADVTAGAPAAEEAGGAPGHAASGHGRDDHTGSLGRAHDADRGGLDFGAAAGRRSGARSHADLDDHPQFR
ncbi:hypothetical protein ACFSTD_13545 [Novosphingobium colocasiae]